MKPIYLVITLILGLAMRNNRLLDNQIYKNVFTEEEIKDLYELIDTQKSEKTTTIPIYAQKVWFEQPPESVVNKIILLANKIYKDPIKLEEISFARYSKEYGDMPILTPHFDNVFSTPRFTVDIQVRSNISWPIVVQDRAFTLKDNEALTFSGTNQVHWREHREFKDGDFIEMIFAHFSVEGEHYEEDHSKVMAERMVSSCNSFVRKTIEDLSNSK